MNLDGRFPSRRNISIYSIANSDQYGGGGSSAFLNSNSISVEALDNSRGVSMRYSSNQNVRYDFASLSESGSQLLKIFEEIYEIEDLILGEGCSSVVKVCRLRAPKSDSTTQQQMPSESQSDVLSSNIQKTPVPSTFSKLRGGKITESQ